METHATAFVVMLIGEFGEHGICSSCWVDIEQAVLIIILQLFCTAGTSCSTAVIFVLTRTPEICVSLTLLSQLVELFVWLKHFLFTILIESVR